MDVIELDSLMDNKEVTTEDWDNVEKYFKNQIEIIEAFDKYLDEFYSQAQIVVN